MNLTRLTVIQCVTSMENLHIDFNGNKIMWLYENFPAIHAYTNESAYAIISLIYVQYIYNNISNAFNVCLATSKHAYFFPIRFTQKYIVIYRIDGWQKKIRLTYEVIMNYLYNITGNSITFMCMYAYVC